MPETKTAMQFTPQALVDYLKDTGTPPDTLSLLEAQIKRNEKGSTDDLLGWMIEKDVSRGTIEKAGKFLKGGTFSLASPVALTASEREATLQEENHHLRSMLRQKDVQNATLMMRLQTLEDQLGESNKRDQPERIKRSEIGMKAVVEKPRRGESVSLPVTSEATA